MMCFDFAKHGRPKVPVRKLSPSKSIKTEVHAPVFYEFASQIPFNTCAKRTKKARQRRAFSRSMQRMERDFLPYFGEAETGRTGLPQQAAFKYPKKVGACT